MTLPAYFFCGAPSRTVAVPRRLTRRGFSGFLERGAHNREKAKTWDEQPFSEVFVQGYTIRLRVCVPYLALHPDTREEEERDLCRADNRYCKPPSSMLGLDGVKLSSEKRCWRMQPRRAKPAGSRSDRVFRTANRASHSCPEAQGRASGAMSALLGALANIT